MKEKNLLESNVNNANEKCLDFIGTTTSPYVKIADVGNQSSGVLINIINILVKKIGKCYNIRKPKEFTFGIPLANGTFNGLIGQAERQETDMIVSALSISQKRLTAIDFSEPFDSVTHAVAYKYPTTQSDILGFLRPFSKNTWMLFMALVVFMMMVLIYMFKIRSENQKGRKEKSKESNSIDIAFLFAIGFITRQALNLTQFESHQFSFKSIRPLLAILLLILSIITTVYTSNLLALLTAPKLLVPFRTLEELVSQNQIPFFAIKDSYFYSTIQVSPEGSTFKKFFNNMKPPRTDYDTFFDVVQDKGIAVACLSPSIEAELTKRFEKYGRCTITFMDQRFLEVSLAMGLPKKTPWKKDLDSIIIRLKEAGIITHWLSPIMSKSSECLLKSAKKPNQLRPLVLVDLYGTFSLFIGGIILSTISFLVEVFFLKSK